MLEKKNLIHHRKAGSYVLLPVVITCAALLASCGGINSASNTESHATVGTNNQNDMIDMSYLYQYHLILAQAQIDSNLSSDE